jgi:hypothetical protein
MRRLDHLHTCLGFHFLQDGLLVRTAVEKTRTHVNCIIRFTHRGHPGLEPNQAQHERCAGTATAVDQPAQPGIGSFLAFVFSFFLVKSHRATVTSKARFILDVLAAPGCNVHNKVSSAKLVSSRYPNRHNFEHSPTQGLARSKNIRFVTLIIRTNIHSHRNDRRGGVCLPVRRSRCVDGCSFHQLHQIR